MLVDAPGFRHSAQVCRCHETTLQETPIFPTPLDQRLQVVLVLYAIGKTEHGWSISKMKRKVGGKDTFLNHSQSYGILFLKSKEFELK